MPKALALISGGLDSLLATKLILDQQIVVEGINFFTGFTGDHDYPLGKVSSDKNGARYTADQLGIKLHLVDAVQEFKPILLNPQHGYGSNLNPCLDCKLFMILQAKIWMEKHGFDFLITGEVLGQRPKSQRKDTLPIASKITNNLIVRPLSAKLLPETLPEKNGWIKRELFCGISGRERKKQIELANKYGFKKFSQPSGGCLLTDVNFCRRLNDLLNHKVKRDYTADDILLLRIGRHLRISGDLKIVVGRNEMENQFMQQHSGEQYLAQAIDYPGALVLLDGEATLANLELTAKIAAYFSKAREQTLVRVSIKKGGIEKILDVIPLAAEGISPNWYL